MFVGSVKFVVVKYVYLNQCCGSVTFMSGSGYADPFREITDPAHSTFFLIFFYKKCNTQNDDFLL